MHVCVACMHVSVCTSWAGFVVDPANFCPTPLLPWAADHSSMSSANVLETGTHEIPQATKLVSDSGFAEISLYGQ